MLWKRGFWYKNSIDVRLVVLGLINCLWELPELRWSSILQIWRIDTKYNILYVHGQAVPGPTHCYVRIFDTSLFYRREAMLQTPPIMPTFFPGDEGENQDEELFDEELFQFNQPSITIADTEKAKKSKWTEATESEASGGANVLVEQTSWLSKRSGWANVLVEQMFRLSC